MSAYVSFTSIVQDSNIHWMLIAAEMKKQVNLPICSHSKKTKGLFDNKWGCGRKKHKDDLCKKPSAHKKSCTAYLSVRFGVNKENAEKLLYHLRDLGWVRTYKCGAVFFNV